jgi:Pectate lyase superfamily protein
MAVNLSPYGGVGAQFLDNSGNVLTGGKIFTYAAGTTTNQATYTTSVGNIPHSNPIILDASGRVPSGGEIWLTDGLAYKFILRDANDVLIATYDGITGINSNFVAFTNQQEIQTATAGQTVFNLTTTTYQPNANNLTVFVDGVNQYGPGAQYAYLETDNDTVTFINGLHVGALVKFTTSQLNTSGSTNTAGQISFTGFKGQVGTVQNLAGDDGSDWIGFEQAGAGAVAVSAQDKMREWISVKDFGAVGDGVVDDTVAIQTALDTGDDVYVPPGTYLCTDTIIMKTPFQSFFGNGKSSKIEFNFSSVKAGLQLDENSTTTFGEGVRVRNLWLQGVENVLMVIYVKSPIVRIYENRITNSSSVVGHGIYCANLNDITPPLVQSFGQVIYDNFIYGKSVGTIAGSIGIRIGERNLPVWIQNNNVGFFDTIISIEGTQAVVNIAGNYLIPAIGIGIDLNAPGVGAIYYNVTIQNNYFEICPVAIRALQGIFHCLKIVDNYSYSQTSISPYGPAPFFWAAATGESSTSQIIVENNTAESHSELFRLDDEYNSRLASTKNNRLVGAVAWATGTYANNAYKIRQFNSYFVKTTVSGTYLGESPIRLESKNAVFRIPIQFEPHEKMFKIEALYGANGGTGVTMEFFKSTSAGVTATSLGSATRNTDGYLTITLNNLIAEANYNYYVTVTYDNTGVSGYFYPVQLYLYE